jgi:uncharacterized protein YkwD
MRLALLALLALTLLALPAAAQTAPQWASEVAALTNAERAKAGCPALTLDARLGKAAQAHTDEMSRRGALAHEGANGSTPGDRATAAGYTWSAVAENIAAGQQTPADAVASWMKSPGHRQNILNCTYRHIGVGYLRRTDDRFGHYWTQMFGAER